MPPRPVCVKCCVEMRVEHTGVFVIIWTSTLEGFVEYAIWSGDQLRCPVCDAGFVARFPNVPISRQHEPRFQSELRRVRGQSRVPVHEVGGPPQEG